jgi:small-conductance mechanosensitive channel
MSKEARIAYFQIRALAGLLQGVLLHFYLIAFAAVIGIAYGLGWASLLLGLGALGLIVGMMRRPTP